MAKYDTAQAPTQPTAGTLKQDAAFGPSIPAMVGTPLAAAAAPGLLGGLILFIVAGLAFMWLDLTAEPRVWVTAGAGALVLCLGITLYLYPERHREVMDGWRKRETGLQAADSDGDGRGAHWFQALQNGGSKPTEAVTIDKERASFLAFIRTAETANTVRALAASGWRDDRLNTIYRQWLNTLVMPDGSKAAENWGKGQWRLRFPAQEICAVVEKLEWVVNAEVSGATIRHN